MEDGRRNTLNRDEDNSRESRADPVHSLAEIVAFVRLLNVVDRQGPVLHANVRIAQFQIGVIARCVPCETGNRADALGDRRQDGWSITYQRPSST